MTGRLEGRRILVVEDEYFIATDIRRLLTQEGAVTVGPVGNLAAGLSLADQPMDAAVLDVNLEEAMSYPIADRLRERGVPYMFLTGYDGWSIPPEYREVERLAKPFSQRSIVAMLEKLVSMTEKVA